MSQAIARKALETLLSTLATAQGLEVAWENVSFTPPDGLYLRSFLLPVETVSQTLDQRHRQYEGVYQVSIVSPVDGGPGAVEALAQLLDAAFPTTAPTAVDGLKLWITRPMGARQPILEEGRYVVPVSCTYRLDTV